MSFVVVNSTTLDYLSIFWSKNGLRCAQTGMGKWLHVQLLAERLLFMTTLNLHSYTLENLWAHPPTAIQGKFRTDTSCDGASSFWWCKQFFVWCIDCRQVPFFECIQEGLWRHSIGRPFFFKIGLKKEAKGRPFFWYPTGFLNTFKPFLIIFQCVWQWNFVDNRMHFFRGCE